ncbi:capsid protein [Aeromonas veronii]|uniref:capsid protein n=1 Tax=Aeromonas veronii TaxID=654 RepID=UPI0024431BFB|nr:capsid protein [Aeromonas veronii]
MNNYKNNNFPIQQTPSFPGQNNGEGDPRALFLKLFAGEVLTLFKKHTVAKGTVTEKQLNGGKSYDFPIVGMSHNAKYHKAGELVLAGEVKHAKRTVTIDDPLVSAVFVSESDDDLVHYDVRGHYVKELAYEMAIGMDKNIFRTVALAAFITDKAKAEAVFGADNVLDDEVFTQNVTIRKLNDDGNKFTRGQQIVDAIYKARTQFRKNNVPRSETAVCVLRPEDYTSLVYCVEGLEKMPWMNKQYQGQITFDKKADASGDTSITGLKIAGFQIYESNNLPDQNEVNGLIGQAEPLSVKEGGSGRTAAYRGDYTGLVGLIYTKDCAATVISRSFTTRWVDEPLRTGKTVIAKMFVGHNILRPACAIAIMESATDGMNSRLPSFITEHKPIPVPIKKPEIKPEVKPEIKPEVKPEIKSEPKPEVKPEIKSEPKPEVKPEIKSEPKKKLKK